MGQYDTEMRGTFTYSRAPEKLESTLKPPGPQNNDIKEGKYKGKGNGFKDLVTNKGKQLCILHLTRMKTNGAPTITPDTVINNYTYRLLILRNVIHGGTAVIIPVSQAGSWGPQRHPEFLTVPSHSAAAGTASSAPAELLGCRVLCFVLYYLPKRFWGLLFVRPDT